MSFAVMPLSDYKATCDKVREKVDLTAVRFEDTDFGYIRSAVFTAKESGEYVFTVEVKDKSKLNIYGIYYAVPEWEDNSSPGMFNVIDGKTLSVSFIKGETVRIFISDYDGLKASDIVFSTLSHNGEVVENFVAPSKIKSGELADKVDEVYMAGASDFGLKGKGQGELVTLNNVHPIEHKVEVGLGSKNLFNEAEADITKVDDYFFSNKNYSQAPCFTLKVESGATYTATVEYYTPNTVQFAQILAFTFSREKTYTNYENSIYIRTKTKDSTNGYVKDIKTFTIPDGVEEIYFIANNDETYFKNVMVEKNSTATTYSPYIADFSDCKVKASGKNLLNTNRELGTLTSGNVNTSVRKDFELNKYYIGFSRTNYYYPSFVTATVENGVITMTSVTSSWYGIAFPFKVMPNTTYALRGEFSENVLPDIAYYDNNGNFIGNANEKGIYGNFSFNTPNNAVLALFNPVITQNGVTVTLSNIQIEIGTTPSEYTEYIEPTEYTANADGTVEGVKSISPVMNLMADKAGAVIDAECFLDPEAVLTSLTNTVITLGGEI